MAQHEDFADHADGHGHSVAAWTAVAVILVGALVMALAVAFPHLVWFVIGAVIAVLGAIIGKVMAMAGFGAKTRSGTDAPESGRPELGTK
jgi:protein-S-isoprenylcysteine O-methyltransferase Ste14